MQRHRRGGGNQCITYNAIHDIDDIDDIDRGEGDDTNDTNAKTVEKAINAATSTAEEAIKTSMKLNAEEDTRAKTWSEHTPRHIEEIHEYTLLLDSVDVSGPSTHTTLTLRCLLPFFPAYERNWHNQHQHQTITNLCSASGSTSKASAEASY
jgi:hypothetical protein